MIMFRISFEANVIKARKFMFTVCGNIKLWLNKNNHLNLYSGGDF